MKNHLAPVFPFHPVEKDKSCDQPNKKAADDHQHRDDGGLGTADVAGVPDVVLGEAGLAVPPQTRIVRAHGGPSWVLVGETSLAQLARWEGFCHLRETIEELRRKSFST